MKRKLNKMKSRINTEALIAPLAFALLVAWGAGAAGAAICDFNGDGHPDYVLYNTDTQQTPIQTAIWYLNNNVYVAGGLGPTLPPGWSVVGVADFNRDGHADYALLNSSNGQTAIWYLSGRTLIGSAYGPSAPSGWALVATADFNGDGHADYLLYNPATRQTAIWYLNNNVYLAGGLGPTLPAGWSLIADFACGGCGKWDY